jgi:oxygen-independent coproporphyrinogen-3 oxidase
MTAPKITRLTQRSQTMMVRSFRNVRYRFREAPDAAVQAPYGIYLHVPFCRQRCSFCPFYKESYAPELKDAYLKALTEEINRRPLPSSPEWTYFGGGTPNLLSLTDLENILNTFRRQITIKDAGIELLPELVTQPYLKGLRELGFGKISIGVESLQSQVLSETGRGAQRQVNIPELVSQALEQGLFVNVDMMLGLPGQTPAAFQQDIQTLVECAPTQITLYPFMQIGDLQAKPAFDEALQFELIEQAAPVLLASGYHRRGVWTFSREAAVYDSSRDELVADYVGYGPAAFSTYGQWKMVNPELGIYLQDHEHGRRRVLAASRTQSSDEWRRFARMIYDLRFEPQPGLPAGIRLFKTLLRLAGYGKRGWLTPKGIRFAHSITKAVVEGLPYPLQNPDAVENWDEYAAVREHTGVEPGQ